MERDKLHPVPVVTALGTRLRAGGLTARGLAAWAGTARLAALAARIEAVSSEPATPAAALFALVVGGAELSVERWNRVFRGPAKPRPGVPGGPELLDALIAHDLVERAGAQVRARVAILPLGEALLVCDRLDAPIERELVCWPDDSSHHLASAIPAGKRADWLDVGCGSAFAPLTRPALAARVLAVDINPRAAGYAQLGAALSGLAHVTTAVGDAGGVHEPAELVTCNAPMPAAASPRLTTAVPAVWRHADAGLFDRLWPALERAVRPGGMIVAHAACDAMLPALTDARGERVIACYTDETVPGFAVAWWRPDAADRLVTARRALTPDRPHIDARDREDALAAASLA